MENKSKSNFPESEKYNAEAISLPIFPGLTIQQQKKIISIIDSPIGHQAIF